VFFLKYLFVTILALAARIYVHQNGHSVETDLAPIGQRNVIIPSTSCKTVPVHDGKRKPAQAHQLWGGHGRLVHAEIRLAWRASRLFTLGVANSCKKTFGVPHETQKVLNLPHQTDFCRNGPTRNGLLRERAHTKRVLTGQAPRQTDFCGNVPSRAPLYASPPWLGTCSPARPPVWLGMASLCYICRRGRTRV
jgi:hypothetical protein